MNFQIESDQFLKIMLDIQKKVEAATTITTEDVMQDLILKLRECQIG
ncbi:hypothetical protein [Fredinandcohnia quinoae]|uniref:Uncharacterized protein n=1 Tax=Fredinandcohnia quinoae TaxID=2918902 RepID=A0AAW5DX22_9BACI|nr:hypothetical protein [Fredinandcohnia sp. SECRCQ15]MCH1625202.1 hypothetical protein [Fredinandcohnia sp. SECRCQ15]